MLTFYLGLNKGLEAGTCLGRYLPFSRSMRLRINTWLQAKKQGTIRSYTERLIHRIMTLNKHDLTTVCH